MTDLHIGTTSDGQPFTLPLGGASTHRIAIIARTGMGKTYTAKNLAEEFVKAGIPFVVIDPLGGWWGMRFSPDGGKAGLPVTILGGHYGDVPLVPTAGAEVAEFIVDAPGHYVLDLSSFQSDAEQDRFAEAFASRLFRAKQQLDKRSPLMLFVDEADAFAPQQPMKGQERMLGAYRTLMRRGRLFGVGMVPITQRPAALNKNVLTQAEMLIVGQITGSQDRAAVDLWVKEHATDEQRAAFLQSLAGLNRGEMWMWSPSWLRTFERVLVRRAETFDSSKTPEQNETPPEPQPLSAKAKASLEKRMAATIEEAKANDPKELRKENARLRRDLAAAGKAAGGATAADVRSAIAEARQAHAEELRAVRGELQEARAQMGRLTRTVERLPAELEAMAARVRGALNGSQPVVPQPIRATAERPIRPMPQREPVRQKPPPAAQREAHYEDDGEAATALDGIKAGAVRMLRELASRYPATWTRSQLAILTRFTPSGGTFQGYLSSLKSRGLIDVQGRDVSITEAGLDAVGEVPAAPQSHEETMAMWRGALKKSCYEMLVAIVEAGPAGISREELAEATTMTLSGGTFQGYISILKRNALIEVEGQILTAADVLFPEGVPL